MSRMIHQKYRSKHTEMKCLNNIQKNKIIKVKKITFQNFKKISEYFTKPINVSVEDMDKLEEKEIMKQRPFKTALYD